VLKSRIKGQPAMRVCAVQGEAYCLQPAEEFGETIALDRDSLAAAYVTDGLQLAIEPPSEMEAWLKLSKEKFHNVNLEADRRLREQQAEDSPEQAFARVARETAEAAK
jgi:hypothetical protein